MRLVSVPPTFAWNVTSEDDPGARDAYRDSFEGLYEVGDLDLGPGGVFFNRTRMTLFSGGMIGQGRSNSQTLGRSETVARRAGFDAISLVLADSPMAGSAGERSFACAPGSIIFADLGRASRSSWRDLSLVNLVIPRDRVPKGLADADFHGLTLPADDPAARLLAGHLRTMAEVAPELGDEQGAAAIGAALAIAQVALGGIPPVTEDERAAVYRTVRERVARFLEPRLLDPALNVGEIARACAVSRTTLYRAFEAESGLKRYIQRRRLELARDALARRVAGRPTVADIAHDHGFATPAHFSRAFRDRFGLSPSDVPPAVHVAPGASSGDVIGLGAAVDWLRGTAAS